MISRVTGKAGENCQYSGGWAAAHPGQDRRLPECGDTLKALAGDQRPIKGGDQGNLAPGSLSTGVTGRSCSSCVKAKRRLNVQSGLRKARCGKTLL